MGVLVEHDLGHFGRGQRIDDKGRRIWRPGNDVDLLALQFADNSLDAAAAHADAGADRIDRRIVRNNGDLGAAARIAGGRANFDDTVVDFRHFLGEQRLHELRPRPAQENLRAARLAAHIEYVGACAVTGAEILAWQRFVAPHDALGAPKIDGHIAVFDALDQPVDDFARAVLVFLKLAFTLGVTHALNDHLLGGLRGDAPEIDRRQLVDEKIAGLGIRLFRSGLLDSKLGTLVLDLLDDFAIPRQKNVAGLAVYVNADVMLRAVFRASGFLDRLLHRLEHFLAIDALFARHRIGDGQHLYPAWSCTIHDVSPSVRLRLPRSGEQFVVKNKLGADDAGQRQ